MSARDRCRRDSHAEFHAIVRNAVGLAVALIWAAVLAAFWIMTP